MSAVLAQTTEVLPARTQIAAAVASPGVTVIDSTTGAVTFEHKGAVWLLADANRIHTEAADLASCIDCVDLYSDAGELLKKITDTYKTLDEKRLETTKPLRDKVDEINADYAPAIARCKQAVELLKGGMLSFDRKVQAERDEAERIARQRQAEEQRRAAREAAAARERAEQEAAATRQRAEQEAATAREQAEAQAAAKREEAKKLEGEGNFARAEQLRAEARELLGEAEEVIQTAMFEAEQTANEHRAAGEMEAESFHQVAEMVTPPVVHIPQPRVSGVSKTTKYSAEVTDAKAFVEYCVANWDTMNHYLTIEAGKLNTLAQNQKERFRIPGCELRSGLSLSSRRSTK